VEVKRAHGGVGVVKINPRDQLLIALRLELKVRHGAGRARLTARATEPTTEPLIIHAALVQGAGVCAMRAQVTQRAPREAPLKPARHVRVSAGAAEVNVGLRLSALAVEVTHHLGAEEGAIAARPIHALCVGGAEGRVKIKLRLRAAVGVAEGEV